MIYLDNSATTKPYDEVLDTFVRVNREFYGNPSSLHNFGGRAEQLLNVARNQIAELAGIHPSEIIFTSGGTEGNNLAIKGVAMQYGSRGKHIITSTAEHASIRRPLEQLERAGFKVTWIPTDSSGKVAAEAVLAAVTNETILVTIHHVNNEVGVIQPIEEIGKQLQKHSKILFHVDHVQGVGKVPLSMQDAAVDLCTFSAHKFHGLKGNGFLYKRDGIKLQPLLAGGDQERKWRSGTENSGGIVSMAKALRIMLEKQPIALPHMKRVHDYLRQELAGMDDIQINSPIDAAPHILNMTVPGFKGEVLVHALEQRGVIVSTTSACSSKNSEPSAILKAMGKTDEDAINSIRLSLSYENTMEEAAAFMASFKLILNQLNAVKR